MQMRKTQDDCRERLKNFSMLILSLYNLKIKLLISDVCNSSYNNMYLLFLKIYIFVGYMKKKRNKEKLHKIHGYG